MGSVYWITGLSGAGKTTIGRDLYYKIQERKENVVFLDGDELRNVFGNDLGYTKEDRFQCAMRYARLCKLLANQGIDVICCTISMFDEVRRWNRINIQGYKEIYIKVAMKVLEERDQKGLYSGVNQGAKEEVAGKNLDVQLPKNPDLTIENNGIYSVEECVNQVLNLNNELIFDDETIETDKD